MDENSYLTKLTVQLLEGVQKLPADLRARHAEYLRRSQNLDGGFSGRQGGSDLYYTAFGLRGLMVLDALTPEICTRAAEFLRTSLTQQTSAIDFFSLLYSWVLVQLGGGPDVFSDSAKDWPERVAALLETFRTPDEGYAKTPNGASGSTYHSFLVALCYEILGKPLPRPEAVARFIRSRRREDGGFVEVAAMRRGGTNPTAAAVALLQMLPDSGLTTEERSGVTSFLAEMASPEGGLRANGRAPLADVLSTFTGLLTLHSLNALDRIDTAAVRRYLEELQLSDGGFHGGNWDDGRDVEYTFYGIGSLALLS